MTKPTIELQFPTTTSVDLMSQSLNVIEDIYRDLKDNDLGEIDDIDSYGSGRFVITVFSKRRLGQAKAIIDRRIRNSRFADVVVESRLDST